MFFPKVGFSVFKNCLVSTHKGLNLLMLMEFLLASYNNYLHVSDFDLFWLWLCISLPGKNCLYYFEFNRNFSIRITIIEDNEIVIILQKTHLDASNCNLKFVFVVFCDCPYNIFSSVSFRTGACFSVTWISALTFFWLNWFVFWFFDMPCKTLVDKKNQKQNVIFENSYLHFSL